MSDAREEALRARHDGAESFRTRPSCATCCHCPPHPNSPDGSEWICTEPAYKGQMVIGEHPRRHGHDCLYHDPDTDERNEEELHPRRPANEAPTADAGAYEDPEGLKPGDPCYDNRTEGPCTILEIGALGSAAPSAVVILPGGVTAIRGRGELSLLEKHAGREIREDLWRQAARLLEDAADTTLAAYEKISEVISLDGSARILSPKKYYPEEAHALRQIKRTLPDRDCLTRPSIEDLRCCARAADQAAETLIDKLIEDEEEAAGR